MNLILSKICAHIFFLINNRFKAKLYFSISCIYNFLREIIFLQENKKYILVKMIIENDVGLDLEFFFL